MQQRSEILSLKVQVKNLNFYYKKHHALKNINLSIPEKCVYTLIGPSGCGKSTLLRTFNRIYGLYSDQNVKGQILLNGKNILDAKQNLNWLRTKVGMVFQKPTPFPMSIYENVAYGIRLAGDSRGTTWLSERIEWALTKAALWDEVKDQLHGKAMALSGGQQQRLCLARTIAMKPEILLLDEPTSALDPLSTEKIEELLGELKKDYTVILVTHNMRQAARVTDFTTFMLDGEVVETGETKRFFARPAQKVTEEYIFANY